MARRALGWTALAYGLAGIALVLVGAIGGLGMADRVEDLALRADTTLAAAERAARASAESFSAVDASLEEAQASADGGALLARDAAATLDSLALSMSISILGTQPLEPLAEDFATSADQAVALADTLDRVGGSLGETRLDMTSISVEIDSLAAELESLRESSTTDGSPPPIRLFVTMVLVWLALQAVGAIIAGAALLRPAPVIATD